MTSTPGTIAPLAADRNLSWAVAALCAAVVGGGCAQLDWSRAGGPLARRQADDADYRWIAAIPTGPVRAELIPPMVPAELLRQCGCGHLLPALPEAASHSLTVLQVNETTTPDLSSLLTVADNANSSANARVVLRGGSSGEPIHWDLPPASLSALAQAASPKHKIVRMICANRPAVVVRDEGVRCIVTPRVERTRGLLQLNLATTVHWGPAALLPAEVRAACGNFRLQCLTLPQTLELLYGDFQARDRDEDAQSFAHVSEQEDYLIPFNYQRLQNELNAAALDPRKSRPCFLDLPDLQYPGPAILGDARALTEFIQQRETVSAGQNERLGWVIFGGDALRHAEQLQITIDLGRGPLTLDFALPE